jgi:hypothetical protein
MLNELIELLCAESGIKRGNPAVSKVKQIDHFALRSLAVQEIYKIQPCRSL